MRTLSSWLWIFLTCWWTSSGDAVRVECSDWFPDDWCSGEPGRWWATGVFRASVWLCAKHLEIADGCSRDTDS